MTEQARWFVPSINPLNSASLPDGLTLSIFDPANYAEPDLTAEQIQKKFAISVKALKARFYDFCNFSPERLALHETIVGVATRFKTRDEHHFIEIVQDIYTHHVLPVIRNLQPEFEQESEAIRHNVRHAASAYFSGAPATESPYTAKLEELDTRFSQNLSRYKKYVMRLIGKEKRLKEEIRERLADVKTTIRHMENGRETIITDLMVDMEIVSANKRKVREIVTGTQEQSPGIFSQEPVASAYAHLTLHGQDTRSVLLVVGGAASGKESITARVRHDREDPDDLIVLNPDRYKRLLWPINKIAGHKKWHGSLTHSESSIVFNNIAERWQEMAESGMAPSILMNVTRANWVQSIVRTDGAPVEIHTPVLPVEKALIRSYRRGELSGRFMPTSPLIQGHKDQPSTILDQIEAGTSVTLYNTNVDHDTDPSELAVIGRYSGDEKLFKIYDMGSMYCYFQKEELNPNATFDEDLWHGTPETTAAAILRYAEKMTIEIYQNDQQIAELRTEAGRPILNIVNWSTLEAQMGETFARQLLQGMIHNEVQITGGEEIQRLIAEDRAREAGKKWQSQVRHCPTYVAMR